MINDKFKKIVFFIFFTLILCSFNVYAQARSIRIWGYCDGPLCPDKLFDLTCPNTNICRWENYYATYCDGPDCPYCQYEGDYFFDAESECEMGGLTQVPAFRIPGFTIDWDVYTAHCECYGKTWVSLFIKFEHGNVTQCCCCGDDEEEYIMAKKCEVDVCLPDDTDDACCNATTDCVYESTCYTTIPDGDCGGGENTCKDLEDKSPDLEVCINNKWYDSDNSEEACKEVNSTTTPTKWMPNGICGMRERNGGDCNDATPATADFCCGDDENEVIREGFDNVCFVKEGEGCYLDGRYYSEGEYEGDKICENGTITSRIKLVALQLLDIVDIAGQTDNYTLFCDSYENTLNYYGYEDKWGIPVTQHLNEVNNICVLKLPEQVIFGASLNKPISDGFIDTLDGIVNCESATRERDGYFHRCLTELTKDSRAWYNNVTQSIIYSADDIYPLPSDFVLNFWQAFLTFLRHPFQTIFNFLLDLFRPKPEGAPGDYEFINSTKKFSRIYLDRKNTKSIMGIAENITGPKRGEYISVTYNGYSEDICGTVNMVYEKFRREGQLGRKDLVFCHYDSGAHYVATNSSMGIALWPELTARLRPR